MYTSRNSPARYCQHSLRQPPLHKELIQTCYTVNTQCATGAATDLGLTTAPQQLAGRRGPPEVRLYDVRVHECNKDSATNVYAEPASLPDANDALRTNR